MSPNKLPPPGTQLAAMLAVEFSAWQALLAAIASEENALIHGDAEHLDQLGAAKLAQLNVVGNLTRTRLNALTESGLPATRAGMDAWLARQNRPELHAQWQQLAQLEADAQAANQRVGSLIDMRLAATRQALNVLVHAATRQGGLYDQAGHAVAARSGKPLTTV